MPLYPITSNDETAEFHRFCAEGRFPLIKDTHTGEYLEPNTETSWQPSRFEWVDASGHGTVVSWSVSHTKNHDGADVTIPFGIVELDEGPWWWGELRVPESWSSGTLTGSRVHVGFEKSGPDPSHVTLPYFELGDDI